MGIGVQSMVRRVPMMIGPLAGGWLITHFDWAQGVHFALLICIFLGAMTMGFQFLMAEPEREPSRLAAGPGGSQRSQQSDRPSASKAFGAANRDGSRASGHVHARPAGTAASAVNAATFLGVVRSFTPALRELLVSDILIRFCERIPYAFVILWAMNHAGLNAQQYGWLVAVEMVTAMFCYIPVAHLADKYGRRPFVLATFGFFTLFPITLIWADTFGWLALAFAVRGLKEFGEPARKALIIGEAGPELRARTYGAYYLIRDCVVTTGSFLGAWLWSLGPRANFIGAAICGALGTAWFWWYVYRKRTVIS